MAGKMGFETVTVRNLTVAGIDGNALFIKGLVPGKLNALVTIEKKDKKDKRYADLIDKKEAINRLRYEKPNMQICFRTEDALKTMYWQ
jgi:hypothetical protein